MDGHGNNVIVSETPINEAGDDESSDDDDNSFVQPLQDLSKWNRPKQVPYENNQPQPENT